jgi:hypothetical protein
VREGERGESLALRSLAGIDSVPRKGGAVVATYPRCVTFPPRIVSNGVSS